MKDEAVKRVLLTFDLEYHDQKLGNITELCNLLKKYGVKACFYTSGDVARNEPRLLKRLHSDGHIIASHGYSHKLLPSLAPLEQQQEIIAAEEAITQATGERPYGFRAPKLQITKAARGILRERGYLWTSNSDPLNLVGGKRLRKIWITILLSRMRIQKIPDIPLTATMDWYFREDYARALEVWKGEYRENTLTVYVLHPWLLAGNEELLEELLAFLKQQKARFVLPQEILKNPKQP